MVPENSSLNDNDTEVPYDVSPLRYDSVKMTQLNERGVNGKIASLNFLRFHKYFR